MVVLISKSPFGPAYAKGEARRATLDLQLPYKWMDLMPKQQSQSVNRAETFHSTSPCSIQPPTHAHQSRSSFSLLPMQSLICSTTLSSLDNFNKSKSSSWVLTTSINLATISVNSSLGYILCKKLKKKLQKERLKHDSYF